MNAKTETNASSTIDTVKLLLAVLILVGGVFAYYWFDQWALPLRVLVVLAATAAGVAVAFTSTQGKTLWKFIHGSRVEIRKVVWPNKQETTQTTIAVFIFTLVMGLFFWGLDSILLLLTRMVTAG